MLCKGLTLYRNPCKNNSINENGLCSKHIIELNAEPIKIGKCIHIRRNNKRCLKNAYTSGIDKDYCSEHSLKYIKCYKKEWCKCCLDLYITIEQNEIDSNTI